MSAPRPRVVLDTNVVLSALIFKHGRLATLRRAWQTPLIEPLASRDTIAELIRALAYPKFRLTAEDQTELLGDYLPFCCTVVLPAVTRGVPHCSAPADQMFLQLALAGRARWLVTGDRALLSLTGELEGRILNPAAFAKQLASS